MARIAIIGGGIGGLACAAELGGQGHAVTVIERATALGESGAGVQISPNGMSVLRALGLAARAEAASTPSRAVCLRRGRDGRRLLRMAVPPEDWRLFHRADLIAILGAAAQESGAWLRLGTVCEAVDGTVVHLAGGSEIAADLVIGADGLHSVLRPVLNGDAAPGFTGQVAWRALVRGVDHPAEAVVHVGPARHLVSYPLRGGELVNLVGVEERSDWAAEGWHHTGDLETFSRVFSDFGGEVPELVKAVRFVNVWGLFRHPVAATWQDGGRALLGDAAHPTLPFLAQGANLALEDAWVLGRTLATGAPLARYQAAREDRVRRAIAAADSNARNYHLRGPRGWAAHLALRTADYVAPQAMMRRHGWLYDWQAE